MTTKVGAKHQSLNHERLDNSQVAGTYCVFAWWSDSIFIFGVKPKLTTYLAQGQ